MINFLRRWRRGPALVAAVLAVCMALPVTALAGTTGTISGTVTDASTGAPIANADVAAASPSGSRRTTTDSHGFYVLQSLIPDTYTVSIQSSGYEPLSLPGVVVQQDLTTNQDAHLAKSLKTIANVHTRAAGSLVQPGTTGDVYNVTGAQLNAISGGNNLHKTLYQYIAAIPGVTGSGFPAQPRIHGGSAADIAYDFDGVPINERITGLFTTNLSNVGMGNVEVFTGGLNAQQAASGLGIINTVVKTGGYPGVAQVTYGTSWQYSNQFETLEYGSATPNGRFSWFVSADNTNSLNQWASGQTYPAYVIEQDNGPGTVKTTDLIGNFHYRPSNKDDIQFLIQNGLGEFNFDYLFRRAPGEPIPLTAVPCPGYTVDPNTWTGATGGTAPNGATCPVGMYFGTANTQNGGGNIWHHYSGIGKLQWNHLINDHSFFAFKLAENFNQYIFDQPVVDANLAQYENSPNFNVSSKCPLYPYQAGTPIQSTGANGTGAVCDQEYNWLSTGYWQNRMSQMYIGSVDYTNALNANTTIKAGIGDEYDNNMVDVYYTHFFNTDGTYPALNFSSDFPTTIPFIYASADVHAGKWLFSPGLRYTAENYLTPQKHLSVSAINPTFSFNYKAGLDDVIRGSATESSAFVGSEYVYRNQPPGPLNGPTGATPYCGPTSTNGCSGFKPDPTIVHSYDLQWEHSFADGTSMKFGPYFWRENNIYETYTPYTCDYTKTRNPCTKAGPSIPLNGGIRQAFGFEFGLNHVDNKPKGVSYWISGTYDNFWASSTSSLNTPWGSVPLPPAAVQRGNLIRSSLDPLFSGTITLDAHMDNVHLLPMLYYQSPVTFYTGSISSTSTGQVTAVPNQSLPWTSLNTTLLVDLPNGLTVGIQGQNVLNNSRGVTPCTSKTLSATPGLGTGCGPFYPAGFGSVQSGLSAPYGSGFTTNQYPNTNQSAPLFMFFISKKI